MKENSQRFAVKHIGKSSLSRPRLSDSGNEDG